VAPGRVRAVVVYSPVERLNLVAALPVIRREWRVSGGGMADDATVLTGLGDVDIGARLAAWRRVEFVQDPERIAVARAQALSLSGGTSVPTAPGRASSPARRGTRADPQAFARRERPEDVPASSFASGGAVDGVRAPCIRFTGHPSVIRLTRRSSVF
jgi:hypothetical protein